MVAAYDPVFPGCVIRARVVGALEMDEGGETEYNIFAVPDDDPRFNDIEALEDMPEQNLREIEQFFEVYKRLEGDEDVEILGWQGFDDTQELIGECMRAYARA
jgi:inorganic pyrophosphatase